jgi:hypothetical protein
MTTPDAPPADARRRPRPRVAVKGQILYGVHQECADVVVRDLTDGGAKVRLTSATGVQITGRLILRIASVDRPCVVAWQSEDEVGLRFE